MIKEKAKKVVDGFLDLPGGNSPMECFVRIAVSRLFRTKGSPVPLRKTRLGRSGILRNV